MIHKISYYFSIKLSSNTDEHEILQYGFECLINSIIPISFFLLFAILQNIFLETLMWMTLFLLLRNYIGGYHASTSIRCIVLSTLYGLFMILCIKYIHSVHLFIEVLICSIITIYHIIFGTILNDKDLVINYKKYKLLSLIIILIESIFIIVFNMNSCRLHLCIFISMISAELLHYIEKIKVIIRKKAR